MDKPIRKAVRCYLIKDNMVVATKYKQGNKEGYYDTYLVVKLKKESFQSKQL